MVAPMPLTIIFFTAPASSSREAARMRRSLSRYFMRGPARSRRRSIFITVASSASSRRLRRSPMFMPVLAITSSMALPWMTMNLSSTPLR